jgi:[NiFe] hydrogenase diaphorase moiety small subunit
MSSEDRPHDPPVDATDGRPTFVLDGQPVPFTPGQTLMQAAQAAGRYIPHLCHHADFAPIGSCKVCSVRLVGSAGGASGGRTAAACTLPAQPGLQVESETPALQHDRQRLVQMLFVEGNHHCPFCEKSGQCHLQAVGYHLGMQDTHFQHAYPVHAVDASHPDVWLDRSRCILCELCVRASRETDGKHVFAVGGRGARSELLVNSPSGQLHDSAIAASDRAVAICPTGALMPKRQGFVIPIGERHYDHADIAQSPEDT